MCTRLCLFGATEDDYYFVENKELLESNGYDISLIVTNHSIYNSLSSVVNFNQINLSTVASLCDCIIICKSHQCFEPFVINWINKFIGVGLNVINYRDMNESQHKSFANQALLKGCKYQCPISAINLPSIKPLSIPVIFVLSLYDNMNKMNTELGIYKELIRRGYNAKLISSTDTGNFFGVSALPLDMFLSTDYMHIINCFNEFIKTIDESQTDALVVGVPSTLFTFNDLEQINVPLYIFNSLCLPDYVLLSVFDNTLKNNDIDDINEMIMHYFGIGVDAMLITNTINDVVTYENTVPEFCFHISASETNCNMGDDGPLIVSENETERFKTIVNNIELKLGV